jgi:hypothetical protein
MCILADPTIGKGLESKGLEKCIGLCLGNSSHQMVARVGHWGFPNPPSQKFLCTAVTGSMFTAIPRRRAQAQ